MDFEALESISAQTENLNKKVFERFNVAYHNAFTLVAKLNLLRAEDPFITLPIEDLRSASHALTQAINTKPSTPHPYALLSYLFFLMNDLELAVKYLHKAYRLAPEWTKIQELRSCYLAYIETLESAHLKRKKGDFSQLGIDQRIHFPSVESLAITEQEEPEQETTDSEESFLILDF